MIVKAGGRTFGWGADVRALPENKDAYGAFVMPKELEAALAQAIRKAGWEPSWRVHPTERVVYLCDPEAKQPWRQTIRTATMRGQFIQVVEAKAQAK